MRMNFCWIIASLRRSTTSPIVNFLSLGGWRVTLPVGLTVRMGVSPLSLENHSRTSSQLADLKLRVVVLSDPGAGAGAPVPGAVIGAVGTTPPGATGTAIGFGWPFWAFARLVVIASPAARASALGSHPRSFRTGNAPDNGVP